MGAIWEIPSAKQTGKRYERDSIHKADWRSVNRRLLNIKELSEYLGISVGSLYQKVFERKIPFVKIGKRVTFDLNVIDDWIKSQSVQPKKLDGLPLKLSTHHGRLQEEK